jgi:uncharacterized RDD family membrane protein YckC
MFLAAFMIIYFTVLRAPAGIWLVLLVRFALDWFYHIICDVFFRGQSPGKRFLGLRVVLEDGSPVSAGASFIRNLLRFADGFIGLYLIAFLSLVGSRGFRRPGDWAAGTLVIYTWQSRAHHRPDRMDWLRLNVSPVIPRRALSFEEKQGILLFARRYPLLGTARADEIAGPLAASLCKDPLPLSETGPSGYLLGIARSFAGEPAPNAAPTLPGPVTVTQEAAVI